MPRIPKQQSCYIGAVGSSKRPNAGVTQVRVRGVENRIVTVSASTMGMTSIGSVAIFYNLPALIAGGTDTANRLGRLIEVHRLKFDGSIIGGQTNSVADDAYNEVRVSLLVGEPTLAVHPGLHGPWDPRSQTGLREVLFDRCYVLQSPAKDSTGYMACAALCQFDLRSLKIPLEYVAAVAGSPRVATIWLSVISDSVAVVNPGFSAGSLMSLEFLDN